MKNLDIYIDLNHCSIAKMLSLFVDMVFKCLSYGRYLHENIGRLGKECGPGILCRAQIRSEAFSQNYSKKISGSRSKYVA